MAAQGLASQVGVAPACRALGVSRATFYRRHKATPGHQQPRPTPARALCDSEREQVLNVLASARLPGDVSLRIGGRAIEPGFAAVLGPIGSYPLRASSDLDRVRLIREMTPNIALASLSSRYAAAITRPPHRLEDGKHVVEPGSTPDGDARFATQAGLTVAWPMPDEHIEWAGE